MSNQNDQPAISPLGHIPEKWRLVKLKDVTTKIGSGATPTGGEKAYLQGRHHYALIRSQNVFDRAFSEDGLAFISDSQAMGLKGVNIQQGDVLLNITGDGITFARACLVPSNILPACVNQHVAIIRANKELCLPDYLLAYLTHPTIKEYIETFNAGGSRRAITKGHIESFVIPLPPLDEQYMIAGILGTMDDKIELNRRMNRTLESIAWTMFRQWLVDRDEITGWEVGTISDYAQVTSGKRPENRQDKADADYKYPLFGGGGIMAYTNKFLYDFPILLTGRVGTLGIIFRVSDPCWASDNTLILISSKPENYFYLYFYLKQTDLQMLNRGSTQPLLTQSDLQKIEIPLPPEKMLIEFTRLVSPMFAKIDANEKESRTLASLRDSLLPKLMRGEVRVRVKVSAL